MEKRLVSIKDSFEEKSLIQKNNFEEKNINVLEVLNFTFERLKDDQLSNHNIVAANIGVFLARLLGYSAEGQSVIYHSLAGHDIGKSPIPDETICSPHRLSPKERLLMDTHAQYSAEILYCIDVYRKERIIQGVKTSIIDNIKHHHLRFDSGLTNEFIDICVIADSTAAMIAKERSYNRRSNEISNVIYLLLKEDNKQFNGRILKIFIDGLVNSKNKEFLENNAQETIDEIFKMEGLSAPLISPKEYFSFLENIIDKKTEITLPINGEVLKIMVEGEPYIISQEPDLAVINAYDKYGNKKYEMKKKKFLFSAQTAREKMLLTDEDIKKAAFIMDANQNLYKFTDLIDMAEISKQISRYGAITEDELRVAIDNLIGEFLKKDDIQEIVNDLINIMQRKKMLEYDLTINVKNFIVGFYERLIFKYYYLRNHSNTKIKKFYKLISKATLNLIENKKIKNIALKRAKIIEYMLGEVIPKVLIPVFNDLDFEKTKKLHSIIDSIPKYNLRGVPLKWLSNCSEAFGNENKKNTYYVVLLYFYLLNVVLSDKRHYLNTEKDVLANLQFANQIINKMSVNISGYAEIFEDMKKLYELDLLIKMKKTINTNVYSKNTLFALIVVNFIGSNGNIPYLDKLIPEMPAKTIFYKWLSMNENIINPSIKDKWLEIKINYGLS